MSKYIFFKGKNGLWPVLEALAVLRNHGIATPTQWDSLSESERKHFRGLVGEFATAIHFNVWPNLDIYDKKDKDNQDRNDTPKGDAGFDLILGDFLTEVKTVSREKEDFNIGTLKKVVNSAWEIIIFVRVSEHVDTKGNFNGFETEIIGWLDKKTAMRKASICNTDKECALHLSVLRPIEELERKIK
jgi:hypothetical protein